jgi:hypothetical protein
MRLAKRTVQALCWLRGAIQCLGFDRLSPNGGAGWLRLRVAPSCPIARVFPVRPVEGPLIFRLLRIARLGFDKPRANGRKQARRVWEKQARDEPDTLAQDAPSVYAHPWQHTATRVTSATC